MRAADCCSMEAYVDAQVKFRMNGQFYKEMPDGHRKAFVVGALDMLCVTYLYAAPHHKARINAMIEYSGKIGVDDLCGLFDKYIESDGDLRDNSAAGSFFIALNNWAMSGSSV
jgi:hypothetical protein